MTACDLFQKLAADTSDRVRLGHSYRCSQGETTITDINALEIVRYPTPNLFMHKAIGQEELNFGFDWEWWIGSRSSGWLRYSIQAKKLSLEYDRYSSLRQKSGGL